MTDPEILYSPLSSKIVYPKLLSLVSLGGLVIFRQGRIRTLESKQFVDFCGPIAQTLSSQLGEPLKIACCPWNYKKSV
jgi:hypothetical protein